MTSETSVGPQEYPDLQERAVKMSICDFVAFFVRWCSPKLNCDVQNSLDNPLAVPPPYPSHTD